MKQKWAGKEIICLLLALVFGVLGIWLTSVSQIRVKAEDYSLKLDAAERMQACMTAVKGYKEELGIPLTEEDWFQTGLLGERFTGITTTLGAVEAKRTSCNPDMAAMVVQMFEEAGLSEGDVIGCGMSGSFPAFDLAVLCAADAMGLKVVNIVSIGSSTYGATAPELPAPAMICRLVEDGLLSTYPVAYSIGGDYDCGTLMSEEDLYTALASFAGYDMQFIYEKDFLANVQERMAIYEEYGPIRCFVGVGGNVTTSGWDVIQTEQGVLAPDADFEVTDQIGLIGRYRKAGIPAIVLLNVKELVSEYGLPYDPEELAQTGTSSLYYQTVSVKTWAALGLLGAASCVGACAYLRKKRLSGEK